MQETFVDCAGWTDFWRKWDGVIQSIPGLKEEMLGAIGGRTQAELRSAISRSGMNDRKGRIKQWQNPHVGSGKGYVAVRADAGDAMAGYHDREKVAIGALTNYLTNGHKVRPPSGRTTRKYRPRARMTRVRGYDFYKTASAQAEKIALQEAERFLQRMGGKLV